jgi:hypothetical protein
MIGTSTRKDDTLGRSCGIAELTNSKTWTAWLRVQARLHGSEYSNELVRFPGSQPDGHHASARE